MAKHNGTGAGYPLSRPFEKIVPPVAPVLLESMRAIGYSFETAIADIIDNAISADATKVSILFSPYDLPHVAIIDNGHGMTSDELVDAMRYGSRNPLEHRGPRDLGRFGLGLKTASLSQCRRLVVASSKNGTVSSWCWDLDIVRDRQNWVLVGLDKAQIRSLPHGKLLLEMDHGTLVLWQNLDRIASDGSNIEQALEAKMDDTRKHLALVFHRLLTSKPDGTRVYLAINNVPVEPLDPYLLGNKATQHLPIEKFNIKGELVTVSPYILPHLSKLTRREMEMAGGEEGLRKNQGFYIYRNARLICWGSWSKLIRQEELTKLARVQVDIPNTLDNLWTLDVKKSSAIPPESLKHNLKRIIERIVERSRAVYTYRGKKARLDGVIHIWERTSCRGGYAYSINSSHPLVSILKDSLPEGDKSLLDDLLRLIQTCFPFDLLYVDMASDRKADNKTLDDEDDKLYADSLGRLADVLSTCHQDDETLLKALCAIEPFASDRVRTERTFFEWKKRC